MEQLYDLALKCRNNSLSKEELITELRGGGIENWLGAFGIIIAIITLINNADTFQVIVPPHLQWLYGNQPPENHFKYGKGARPRYSNSSLHLQKPSDMPQVEYSSLTKEQRRNLPDPRDGFINVEGHPKLTVRYGQVNYKTSKHGDIHGLPVDQNGKIRKTVENTLALIDSLVKMPERENILWFDNGGYQKGTTRGYDSVNLFDRKNGIMVVYKKQKNGEYLFSTTCEVTPMEAEHLLKNGGNFVTESVLKNQKGLTIINPITNKNNENL